MVAQLKEMVILPLLYPDLFKRMGITPPRHAPGLHTLPVIHPLQVKLCSGLSVLAGGITFFLWPQQGVALSWVNGFTALCLAVHTPVSRCCKSLYIQAWFVLPAWSWQVIPERHSSSMLMPCRGVLFWGEPGTGKTLAARALAGACAAGAPSPVAFFARKGADCLGKFAGEAERTLRLLFDEVVPPLSPAAHTCVGT